MRWRWYETNITVKWMITNDDDYDEVGRRCIYRETAARVEYSNSVLLADSCGRQETWPDRSRGHDNGVVNVCHYH